MSSTESGDALVKAAERQQNLVFLVYIAASIVSIVLAVYLYKAQNRVTDTIKAAAEARLELNSKRIESDSKERIARADLENRERIERVQAEANQKIAETKILTAKLEQSAAKLQERNLETEARLSEANRALGEEIAKSTELQKSLAPRNFEIVVAEKSNFEELKPFAGTRVIFEVLTDAEANRAANEVKNLVTFAGWGVSGMNANPELWAGFYDGVSIVPPGASFPHGPLVMGPNEGAKVRARTSRAAEALAFWLMDHNVKASVRNNISNVGEIPDDTLKIYIGYKPNPFFEPDWVKGMEKMNQQILREIRKREQEFDKQFPPPTQPQD